MKTAILLIGHGSRVVEANQDLYAIAGLVQRRLGCPIVEVAFCERALPTIQDGIEACVAQGAERILLYPYFLSAGAHVLADLPQMMTDAGHRHPGLELFLGRPLGAHPKLAEIVSERIVVGLGDAGWQSCTNGSLDEAPAKTLECPGGVGELAEKTG